ncbi:MAG: hypothetical protein JXR78_17580 [Victivallales bacterium]|nr:hypothetical protein [Victivallales bacterium]
MEKNNDTKLDDLTIREAMLLVLDKSPMEFARMKDAFKRVSDCFDLGDDVNGLQILSEEVFPLVRSLAEFCTSIFDHHLLVLGEDVGYEFCEKLKQLNELLTTLAEETHSGNFTEIGDILRFDMMDFISGLDDFFPEIRKCFEAGEFSGLDKHRGD